jgi:tetratricopeptide (TPR) repeat protein
MIHTATSYRPSILQSEISIKKGLDQPPILTLEEVIDKTHIPIPSFLYNRGSYDVIQEEESLAHSVRARIALDNSDYDTALKELTTAASMNPFRGNNWYNLTFVYHKYGQIDEAIKAAIFAVKLEPKEATHWVNLGVIYREQGNFSFALTCFKKMVALEPEDRVFMKAIKNLITSHMERLVQEGHGEAALVWLENNRDTYPQIYNRYYSQILIDVRGESYVSPEDFLFQIISNPLFNIEKSGDIKGLD